MSPTATHYSRTLTPWRRDLGPASMLFNNAGVDLFASVVDMSWTDFDWLMGINIGGVVNGTKAFLPHLIESAQMTALPSHQPVERLRPDRDSPSSAYNASKFAVRGVQRGAASRDDNRTSPSDRALCTSRSHPDRICR